MAKIVLTFIGDMMCQMQQIRAVEKAKQDYDVVFGQIRQVFESSDIVIGNLETPIAGRNARYAFEETRFNAPDEFLEGVARAGVGFVSTANNHCMDRGVAGVDATIKKLDALGIGHTGTYLTKEDSVKPCIVEVGGVKIGIVSCTYEMNQGRRTDLLPDNMNWKVDQLAPPKVFNTTLGFAVKRFLKNCIPYAIKAYLKSKSLRGAASNAGGAAVQLDSAPADAIGGESDKSYREKIRAKIKAAKETAELVVVLPHIGGQYNAVPGPFQKWTAQWMAEAGADLIICNHAHTVLPFERLESGAFIAYALGNFSLTPGVGYYRSDCQADNSVVLNIEYDSNKKEFYGKSFYVTLNRLREDGISEIVLASPDEEETKVVVRRFSGHDLVSDPCGKYLLKEVWQ